MLRFSGGTDETSFPEKKSFPESGFCRPEIILRTVVLPEPLGPTIETNEPEGISAEKFFSNQPPSFRETFSSLSSIRTPSLPLKTIQVRKRTKSLLPQALNPLPLPRTNHR